MEQQINNLAEKTKLSVYRFAALGGTASLVGLVATNENLATNPTAQNIGMYSAIIAGSAVFGALWKWATFEDKFEDKKEKMLNNAINTRDQFRNAEKTSVLDKVKRIL